MKIKEGATISGINLKMRPALVAADRVWKRHGQELVITGGLDGEHSAGSLHYYGYAVDLRTRYFGQDQQLVVYKELKEELNEIDQRFDVVYHASHIHVEYDIFKEVL
jgi:hypothetical protein